MCQKLDLHKAIDNVQWDIIQAALINCNFPCKAINWKMECIQNLIFSVLVDGKSNGFFNSTKGLPQGCPLSPNMFCLVMEPFSAILNDYTANGQIANPFRKKDIIYNLSPSISR